MEEVIIVIRIEYFDIYEEKTCEYAMSFNVSNAVYLALLTGGEPAIKSYYRSNGFGDREKKNISSATMTTARIIERGEKIVKNKNRYNEVITCLKSSEDKVNVYINDRFFETINIPRNFKELVKISYGYVDSEYGYVDKEDVYAFCEDKSYYDLLEP